jgi:capsular polysaccharide biosynthesis protein
LKSLFEPLGFLFYYPEEHSTENQFETFAAADLIIGVMGAGMCNSLFTPSGSTVIYIAPEGWEETFFWNLANKLEHKYHAYYSRTNMESEIPELNTFALNTQDFYAFFLAVTS